MRHHISSSALVFWLLAACAKAPAAGTESPTASAPDPSAAEAPAETGAADTAPVAAEPGPAVVSVRPAEWGYEGALGPANWASLNSAYAACGSGKLQSPVNVDARLAKKTGAFSTSYGKARVTIAHHEHVEDIVDNGHTIQVTVQEGGSIQTGRDTYQLKQFHFHTPSENTILGKQYPMEAHFVHQSASGHFAVIAVLFEEGKDNPNLAQLIDHLPQEKGQTSAVAGQIDLALHLPHASETFHFTGSFTTPPCTEDVEWVVMAKPVQAGKAQLRAFAERLGQNNRPVQNWNERALDRTQLSAN